MFSIYNYTDELSALIQAGESTLDAIHGIADQAVPVYNADIIREWSDRPGDWDRYTVDLGAPNGTIIQQMSWDLYMSYRDELLAYVDELTNELND